MAGSVDQWISLGDSVGLYPQVNEVLNWQIKNNVLYVQGDHEQALIDGHELDGSFTGTESIAKQAEVISSDHLQLLSNLPKEYDLELDGLRICATHFLTPDSHTKSEKYSFDLSILEKRFEGYDFVFFGHTHLPAILYGRNTIFINPGSAGFPIDFERRCSMVILDTSSCRFDLLRFDYDFRLLIETIELAGFNQKLVSYIKNGHRWS